MQVTLLGTGTSHGVPVLGCQCPTCTSTDFRDVRFRCAALVEVNGLRILIDTPPEFRLQSLKAGIPRIDAVLITHPHSDHVCGFDDLRRFNELQQAAIPVYSSADTCSYLKKMYPYIFNHQVEPGGGKPSVELHPVTAPFSVRDTRIIPLPVSHGRLTVLGYRIDNFAYVTDCKVIPDSTLELLTHLDLLVLGVLRFREHETHLNLEEALAIIHRLQPKRTLFTHISHDFKHSDSVNWLPPGVELGFDGLQIKVR